MNANWSIENKKVLITGGTDGIGKVTALELAKHGAHVIVVGRNPQKTENTVREIRRASGNEKVDYLLADLSEQNEVRRIAAEYRRRYDRLHVLINNADTPEIVRLYRSAFERSGLPFNCRSFETTRSINRKPTQRRGAKELAVWSYDL